MMTLSRGWTPLLLPSRLPLGNRRAVVGPSLSDLFCASFFFVFLKRCCFSYTNFCGIQMVAGILLVFIFSVFGFWFFGKIFCLSVFRIFGIFLGIFLVIACYSSFWFTFKILFWLVIAISFLHSYPSFFFVIGFFINIVEILLIMCLSFSSSRSLFSSVSLTTFSYFFVFCVETVVGTFSWFTCILLFSSCTLGPCWSRSCACCSRGARCVALSSFLEFSSLAFSFSFLNTLSSVLQSPTSLWTLFGGIVTCRSLSSAETGVS